MKAVILAGGLGARISEEPHLKPEPMIEIGGKPTLLHSTKIRKDFFSTQPSRLTADYYNAKVLYVQR